MERSKLHNRITKLSLAGLCICLGLLIPYFSGHAMGVPGSVLLPMHIPVLIAGLLLGYRYGAICGFVTPIVSSLLTGMPALWPMLPMMACELTTYGVVTGILRKKFKMPLYLSLIGAMIAGRIVSGIVYAVIVMPASITPVMESVITTLMTGLPGILIQLAIIPAAVKLLERKVKIEDADGDARGFAGAVMEDAITKE